MKRNAVLAVLSTVSILVLAGSFGCDGSADPTQTGRIIGDARYDMAKTWVGVVTDMPASDPFAAKTMRDLGEGFIADELRVFGSELLKHWEKVRDDPTAHDDMVIFAEMAAQKIRGEEVTYRPPPKDIPDHVEKPGSRGYVGP